MRSKGLEIRMIVKIQGFVPRVSIFDLRKAQLVLIIKPRQHMTVLFLTSVLAYLNVPSYVL